MVTLPCKIVKASYRDRVIIPLVAQTRRGAIELRALILEAAENAFDRDGYSAVTLKEVAREAGVTESVLYRHFPSKAALFRESVLQPLMNVLSAFAEASLRYLEYPLDDRALMRLVMGGLLDQLSDHRAVLRSFVAAEDDLDPADREQFRQAMADLLRGIDTIAREEGKRRNSGNIGHGVEMTSRLAVGMIISVVVHDQWLLRDLPRKPTRAAVLDHITEIMLRAVGASTD